MKQLWTDETLYESLSVCHGIDSALYSDVLSVRTGGPAGGSHRPFDFDEYSHHYCFACHGEPIGCLSVTRLADGPLDCESYYPPRLLSEFHDNVASSCKLRVLSTPEGAVSGPDILYRMVRLALQDQIQLGVRLDVINATARLARFYSRRLGYVLLDNTPFIHPELGSESYCLYLPADAERTSLVQEFCQPLLRPLPMQAVIDALTPTATATLTN